MTESSPAQAPALPPQPAAPSSSTTPTPSATPAHDAAPSGLFDATDAAVDAATKASRPDWLHEKYATAEDQARGYSELQKKFLEKAGTPEKYDFAKVIETHKANLDTSNPAFAALTNELKDNGFNQGQATWLMDRYLKEASAIRAEVEGRVKASAPPNLAEEKAKLKADWGSKTDDNLKQVASWANANLEPDVVRLLNQSAQGTKFIHAMMSGQKGPIPLRDSPAQTGTDIHELEAQRQETIRNPDYGKSDAIGKRLQAKAMEISERIIKLNGGSLVRPA